MHGIDSLGAQPFYPDAEDLADSAQSGLASNSAPPGSLKRKNEDEETQQPAKRGRGDDLSTSSQGHPFASANTSLSGNAISTSPVLPPAQSGTTEPQGSVRYNERGDARINMKKLDRERKRLKLPGGASPMNVQMADRVAKKHGENGLPQASGHQVAERQPDGEWLDQATQEPLSGRFIYARMNDGEIRLGSSANGKIAHAALTGNAKSVAYAGEVEFVKGTVREYTNQSGTYVPPAALRFQSGFGQGSGFRDADHSQRPVHQSTEDKVAAGTAAESAARSRFKRLQSDPHSDATDGQWRRLFTGKWENG